MVEPLRFSEMTESDRDAFIRDARSPFDFSLEFSDGEDVANEVIGTASPPDCDKWSQSIEVLLDDPAGLEVFRTFLTDQKREEGLSFWMATKMFRDNAHLQNGEGKEKLQLQARTIFTQYLAKNASQRVFIRDSTARKIGAALQAKAAAGDLFVDAQAEAVARMTERDYPEFLRSAIFREYVEKASRRRQRQYDPHSDVLLTVSVQDNGEPASPPCTQSMWGDATDPSPLWDTRSVSTATGDGNDATSVSDMATNNEESTSKRNQRRHRIRDQRSKREAAALRLENLPKEEFAEEVPRPRKPQPTIKPAEFSCLLEDRLNEVIRNRELPRALGGRSLLDDIAEQPEQSDCSHMSMQSLLEQLSVPPVSSRMSDVSSESGTSQASAEWYSQHKKERAAVGRRMPTDSGHHSDLLSSVEDLVRATKLSDTPAQQRHRRLSQQRHEHQHHHKHSHLHQYVTTKDRHHVHPLVHDASSTASFHRSRGRKDFSSQSMMSDPWAMASPDQRSVYSSTSADETLSLTFERQYAAGSSSSSSVVSYRSNPEHKSERPPLVYSCATRYDSSHMRAHNQHRYRQSNAKGIEVIYKLNGDKYRQYLPGPRVTLADFKTLLDDGNYKYFFQVEDPSDPEGCFEEFTCNSDLLPIYNGQIRGRVRAQKVD